jgi:ADP-ribosylglycohydrolase
LDEKKSDRIKGSILGAAVGNSLGGTCLGMNRKEIMFSVGIRGVRDFTPGMQKSLLPTYEPGDLLADTLLAVEIARSLIETKGSFDSGNMKQHLTQLLKSEQFLNAAPGAHCLLPLRRMADDIQPKEECEADSTHVSAAARAYAIGCLPSNADIVSIAVEQAKLSQADTRVWAAAAVLASSINSFIEGQRLDTEEEVREFVRKEYAIAQDIEPRFAESWDDIAPDLDYTTPADDLPYSLINVQSHVNEAVPTAVGIFLIFRHDFEEAVSAGASCGGDTDTVAAIVGALAGAYHGASAIPERWLKRISQRDELERVSNELIGLWNGRSSI